MLETINDAIEDMIMQLEMKVPSALMVYTSSANTLEQVCMFHALTLCREVTLSINSAT